MKSTLLITGLCLVTLFAAAQQSNELAYDPDNPFEMREDGRMYDPVNQRVMEVASNNVKLYPSPALGDIYVEYTLEERSNVVLDVFNKKGKHLGMLENRQLCPGAHEAFFPTGRLRPGTYYVHVQIGDRVAVREVEILRM